MREETCCCHIGYSFRLTARILLYAPSHRQDSTYHGHGYTSRGALGGTRNSSIGPPHEGSIWQPIIPWVNTFTMDNTYHGLWYTSHGALAGTRNSSMGPPHEGLIRRPISHHERTLLPRSYISLHWSSSEWGWGVCGWGLFGGGFWVVI